MDVSYTGKAPSIRWGGIHSVVSAPPDFNPMGRHCEICLHTPQMPQVAVKASSTSFQLLYLLSLLIKWTYKLDICESIQCKSQQNCNTSFRYNNTNHMSTTIKDIGRQGKQNNAMEGKNQNWKKPRSSTCKTNPLPLWWYPFSKSLGHLGSKVLV